MNIVLTKEPSDLEAYSQQIMDSRTQCFGEKYAGMSLSLHPTGYILATEGSLFVAMMSVILEPRTGNYYIFDVCKNPKLSRRSEYRRMFERLLKVFLTEAFKHMDTVRASLNLEFDNPLFRMLLKMYARNGFSRISDARVFLGNEQSSVRLDAEFKRQ
jgi:hypothetical protein